MEEVIIDFAEDKENKIKNFLQFGSFYVALTRVRNGQHVFLKSFDKSYIVENKNIATKLEAFKKFNYYKPKKVYLDENIFVDASTETKCGYLNINGLMSANHADYLNKDRNLKYLDLLAIAETKLSKEVTDEDIENVMSEWKIVKRYDAPDNKDHMGILIMIPRNKLSQILPFIETMTELNLKRDGKLQCQGLKLKFHGENGIDIGFLYCRQSPTVKECQAIVRKFNSCHFVLGDLNLSAHHPEDKKKLDSICGENKYLALSEITRLASSNQLDHIIADKTFSNRCYSSSYLNFISDHKSICVRFNFSSIFSTDFLQRITFDEEQHRKHLPGKDPHEETIEEIANPPRPKKRRNEMIDPIQSSSAPNTKNTKEKSRKRVTATASFNRCFANPDASSCWLNSCLQLIFSAFDHCLSTPQLQSPLGKELLSLHRSKETNINPLPVRSIMMCQERKRIQENPNSQFLNLEDGQQCCRDFFISLTVNYIAWQDLFNMFSFQIVEETMCGNINCNHINRTTQVNNEIYEKNKHLSYAGSTALP